MEIAWYWLTKNQCRCEPFSTTHAGASSCVAPTDRKLLQCSSEPSTFLIKWWNRLRHGNSLGLVDQKSMPMRALQHGARRSKLLRGTHGSQAITTSVRVIRFLIKYWNQIRHGNSLGTGLISRGWRAAPHGARRSKLLRGTHGSQAIAARYRPSCLQIDMQHIRSRPRAEFRLKLLDRRFLSAAEGFRLLRFTRTQNPVTL